MSDTPPWEKMELAARAAMMRGDVKTAIEYASAAEQAWEQHCEAMYGKAMARNEAREEASVRHHKARCEWEMER